MSAVTSTFSPLVNLLAAPGDWGGQSLATVLLGAATSIVLVSAHLLCRPTWDGKVYEPRGIPVVATWSFFSKRYDFMLQHFGKSGTNMFRFRFLQFVITALRGEKARKVFFNDQSLDLSQGYRILMGGVPSLEDVDVKSSADLNEIEHHSLLIKRVLGLMCKDRTTHALPPICDDIHLRMKEWGSEGRINPFKNVYDLVVLMTVRIATCRELAEDHDAIERLAKWYWQIENSITPFARHFPWFPGSANKIRKEATANLYSLLLRYVKLRRESSTPSTDPIDIWIADGAANDDVIQTIMNLIFAGVLNTGVNSCWALLQLGMSPKWKSKAIDEFKALVSKYTDILSPEPLHRRLSSIPLNAWETELPSIGLVIRETLRVNGTGTALRRNMNSDIVIDDVTIKKGEFLVFSLGDVHMNPEIYTNPSVFDPDRYMGGREEDKKEAFGYIVWGAGRHPCPGMKIAKLEIKLILALMLLGFEYELVDESGNYPKSIPEPDRNDTHQVLLSALTG